MFGVIVSGRLVQTDAKPISETQVLFDLPDADHINHVVVFMTGQTPFPDGLGGAVYFSWPSSAGQSWHLLGHISNMKPSAIFKISTLKTDAANSANPFGDMAPQSHLAQIGISALPLSELEQQTPAAQAAISTMEPFVEFSKKMCENLFNYVSSFAQTQSQMTPNPTETFVRLSTLQTWYQNFERRLQQNPYFWRS